MTNYSGPPLDRDQLVTLQEGAELTGHDYKTLYNDLGAGVYPDAVQDTTGRKTWRVPLHNLVDAGRLPESAIASAAEELAAARESRETRRLREELIRKQEQLAAAELRIQDLLEARAEHKALIAQLLKKVA